MKITPCRARRIRDEMRQWLRSQHGVRAQYSREEIDRGREELGFTDAEDLFVAYTLFGGDLMPSIADSLGFSVTTEEISEILAAADFATEATALLIDD